MTINPNENFTIISFSNNKTETIIDFIDEFSKKYSNFKDDNLIVDLSLNNNTDLKKILLFSQQSDAHKSRNKSFVIVCKNINYNSVPNHLTVVPTLKEAEDIIEIEDIERDLGI